eukprot:1334301-Pyramimonas_sp.AAC.1
MEKSVAARTCRRRPSRPRPALQCNATNAGITERTRLKTDAPLTRHRPSGACVDARGAIVIIHDCEQPMRQHSSE